MSPEENQLLTTFLTQLSQVNGIVKDPQAAAMIADTAARQPDATYLLVQRALLQDQAIKTARERIAALEAQVRAAPAATSGSFLDAGNNAWGRSTTLPASAGYPTAPPQYAPAATMPAAGGLFGGGGGSFLTTMAATAAGVAGGAFLFQGIESMMHHGGSSHLMDQSSQPNSFGSMADSVDNPSNLNSADTAAPMVSNDAPFDNDIASDDSSAGGDDSNA